MTKKPPTDDEQCLPEALAIGPVDNPLTALLDVARWGANQVAALVTTSWSPPSEECWEGVIHD